MNKEYLIKLAGIEAKELIEESSDYIYDIDHVKSVLTSSATELMKSLNMWRSYSKTNGDYFGFVESKALEILKLQLEYEKICKAIVVYNKLYKLFVLNVGTLEAVKEFFDKMKKDPLAEYLKDADCIVKFEIKLEGIPTLMEEVIKLMSMFNLPDNSKSEED